MEWVADDCQQVGEARDFLNLELLLFPEDHFELLLPFSVQSRLIAQ